MNHTLYIMVGIPGSGKSTGARKLSDKTGSTIVCPDDIRAEKTGDASNQGDDDNVWKTAFGRLHGLLKNGDSVIFDATSVNVSSRKPLIKIGKKYKCDVVACVFPITLQTAIDRQDNRDRKVPTHVIEKFYNKFKMPSTSEGFDGIFRFSSQD